MINRRFLIIIAEIILFSQFILSQENVESDLKFNFSTSYVSFSEGQQGFAISNGVDYKLNDFLTISPDLYFGFGKYEYSQQENHEPSYSEAKILSIRGKLSITPLPNAFSKINILIGPSLNFYSIESNYEYSQYKPLDLKDKISSSKTYIYDSGRHFKETYLGLISELEFRIINTNKIHLNSFINIDYYIHPLYVEYFGIGLRTKFKV
ncbi:MAG: hypothetical protein R6W78_06335 [Bacteroidales bacterium]